MMRKNIVTYAAFSIIEVLIGIFIFSLGLVSIYALLASSQNLDSYNKNAIIASNLAREQIELFRNIRDTNYTKLQVWNQKNPEISYASDGVFEPGKYYTIENNFSAGVSFETLVQEISDFSEGKESLADMESYIVDY